MNKKIIAKNKKQYIELIKAKRATMNINTYTDTITELENMEQTETVIIYKGAKIKA